MKKERTIVLGTRGTSFVWGCFFVMSFALMFSAHLAPTVRAVDDPEEVKDDIKDLEKKIEKEQKNLTGLTKTLQVIDGNLTATQRAIQTTQQHIETTQETIARKQAEIVRLEDALAQQKKVLRGVLQSIYDSSEMPISEVVFHTEQDVSQILQGSDYMLSVEESVSALVEESMDTKKKIDREREELAGVKQEKERLLLVQNSQKKELLGDKQETQSDIVEKQATIGELREKLAELESDLNTLTGKSYDAKDIREAVEFASGKTGVPKGVLYGFLKIETNLGANTGQCTYKEVEKVAVARYKKYGSKYKNSIALLYTRRDLFYTLVDDLGYSKDKKVSCSPSNYIGQGGAMGVAQFMSDTWRGYVPEIRSKTGHGTPDPWNLTDGVMALALKVRNAGGTSDSESAIRKAAKSYLGSDSAFYYKGVIYWSKNYKTLFN